MNLPSQSEVNAAARHAASFAAGAIAVFGLSTKIDPNTVQQVIAATGTLVNDGILLIGFIIPIVTSLKASQSATPKAQAEALTAAVPGTVVVTSSEIANATPNSNIVSTDDVKVLQK